MTADRCPTCGAIPAHIAVMPSRLEPLMPAVPTVTGTGVTPPVWVTMPADQLPEDAMGSALAEAVNRLVATLLALGETRVVLWALVERGPRGADGRCIGCGSDSPYGRSHAPGCAWEAARRLLEGGDDDE